MYKDTLGIAAPLTPISSVENLGDERREKPPTDSTFEINSAHRANWIVRKIVESRKYAKNVEQWAAAEIARAESRERRLWERFGKNLESWLKTQLEVTRTERRSLNLPAGRLGFRKKSLFLIKDQTALLAWCRAHLPTAVRVHIDATGPTAEAILQTLPMKVPDAQINATAMKAIVTNNIKKTGDMPAGVEMGIEEKFYIG